MSVVVDKRYDFVFLFDVKDGNPNGDPDFANAPRFDPETFQGLVSDVCLKSKVRQYVHALKSQNGTIEEGYDIFILQGKSLESRQKLPYTHFKELKPSGHKTDSSDVAVAKAWMCEHFFDIRAFGAVMSTTDFNCGQVRGPVQITFSRSIDRVLSTEHAITRKAHTTEIHQRTKGGATDVGTMGSKHTVAYGLYCTYGFVNGHLAKQTGFTYADLDVLWNAFANMFDLDHSASRGMIGSRHLIVFEHRSALGEAPAHKLFDLIQIKKKVELPRTYEDYTITTLDELKGKLSAFAGVSVSDKLNS